MREIGLPNLNLLDGNPLVNNFDPILPARYEIWINTVEEAPTQLQEAMLDRMGVDSVLELDAAHPLGVSFNQRSSLDRIRWVPCSVSAANGFEALKLISLNKLIYPQEVILEDYQGIEVPQPCNPSPSAEVRILSDLPNTLEIEVTAEKSGYIVLADIYYPGWRAAVDGDDVDIYQADYLFRAVEVTEGQHKIIFEYRPTSFYLGVVVTIFAWSLWGFLAWKESRE